MVIYSDYFSGLDPKIDVDLHLDEDHTVVPMTGDVAHLDDTDDPRHVGGRHDDAAYHHGDEVL